MKSMSSDEFDRSFKRSRYIFGIFFVLVLGLMAFMGYTNYKSYKECIADGHKSYECQAIMRQNTTTIVVEPR